MEIEDFIPLAHEVINELPRQFDAHAFIRKFMKLNERVYIDWLYSALPTKADGRGYFQAVHQEIGILLDKCQEVLNIQRNGKAISANCFGDNDSISNWIKK